MTRPNYNLIRFIRRCISQMKREYGGPVTIYHLNDATTNLQTGVKSVDRDSVYISRAVVLPKKLSRDAVQSISLISANKKVVQGGTYDPGTRTFIIDRRDVPSDWDLRQDDWIVYDSKRYDMKWISEFEQKTAWLVVGREVERLVPEEDIYCAGTSLITLSDEVSYFIRSRILFDVADSFGLSDVADHVLNHTYKESASSTLSLSTSLDYILNITYSKSPADTLSLSGVASATKSKYYKEAVNSNLSITDAVTFTIPVPVSVTSNLSMNQTVNGATDGAIACPLLDWTLVGSAYWANYRSYIETNKSVAGTNNISTFNASSTGFLGAAVGPDATTIWAVPRNNTVAMKIDTTNQTTFNVGTYNSNLGKWYGAVLGHDGKIYGVPYRATTILRLDPSTGNHSTFGSLSTTVGKWWGGVLAGNSKIYGVPYNEQAVLKVDPSTNTATTFGTLSGSSMYAGGALASNGDIYCAPFNASTVLRIHTNNDTVSTFGSLGTTVGKWQGATLATNNKIYCAPYSGGTILKIDPSTDTTTTIGSYSGTLQWHDVVMAPNGMLYFIPFDATTILRLNPATDFVTTITVPVTGERWAGGFLALDGKIYCIPYAGNNVLVIDPDSDVAFCTNICKCAYFNKS